jgi:hypothetical protein
LKAAPEQVVEVTKMKVVKYDPLTGEKIVMDASATGTLRTESAKINQTAKFTLHNTNPMGFASEPPPSAPQDSGMTLRPNRASQVRYETQEAPSAPFQPKPFIPEVPQRGVAAPKMPPPSYNPVPVPTYHAPPQPHAQPYTQPYAPPAQPYGQPFAQPPTQPYTPARVASQAPPPPAPDAPPPPGPPPPPVPDFGSADTGPSGFAAALSNCIKFFLFTSLRWSQVKSNCYRKAQN